MTTDAHASSGPGPASGLYPYVIVTAAHNEAAYIEKTIVSVISQTHLPRAWVIVSDGSWDGTDDIVMRYALRHDWIVLKRIPDGHPRMLKAKARCVAIGHEMLSGTEYEIIANVDADVSFEPDHFESLIRLFMDQPRLGVAGTPFYEESYASHWHRWSNLNDPPGPCQCFRRRCFEQIGGYNPFIDGGMDTVAATSARMHGWATAIDLRRRFMHHRAVNTAARGRLGAVYDFGRRDYLLGGHPLWEVARATVQTGERPWLLRGVLLLAGYFSEMLRGRQRPLSREFIAFRQEEQMQRLRQALAGILRRRRTEPGSSS
ncbi:glycosyltransferase family 2 protein [bacterium]|nr:glycosyltransferase family 2 protein [bacterium]